LKITFSHKKTEPTDMAIQDDYLPCKAYLNQPIYTKNDSFSLFSDPKTGKFYFALLGQNKSTALKSEGYTSLKASENGIKAVLKNILDKTRLSIVKNGKKYNVILKAGNNQEIARSCDFTSLALAEAHLEILCADFQTDSDASKPKNETSSLASKSSKEEPQKKQILTLANFEPVSFYLNKERIWDSYGITGFTKFMDTSGQYYFGVYNPDMSLYLRSEGFASADERDNCFDLMESTILLEENYKIEQFDGAFYAILFEENEILAISPPFDSFISAFVTTPGGRPKENFVGTIY
jgi:uncharacterized protein YegP (UPF0339 family)